MQMWQLERIERQLEGMVNARLFLLYLFIFFYLKGCDVIVA